MFVHNPVDIIIQMDPPLAFLAAGYPALGERSGLWKYCEISEKRVLFLFRTGPQALTWARRRGARAALQLKLAQALHLSLNNGDVLLMESPDGRYETKLFRHLSPGFGVKKGLKPSGPPAEAEGMRLLGFAVIAARLPEGAALMGKVLGHLISCTTADL